ncbi:related to TRM44-tRNA(Ser) Um(44) 2`-O-methyltransferase [Sporisorium reilianum f. sp. reilianum]|uniref:tRNA (uracil-O(2)-)-methyltransferase n=1 Tax=Sporisorium reilianum f. sp. reilianum TaxID=72559 RepID=A0A2N8U6P2_9BASI|nr:related to TRM44-tRNA(Ser) Um(44) 2`-O-methyltransferase [Sporisorium reilianum f. sp. reilianum]
MSSSNGEGSSRPSGAGGSKHSNPGSAAPKRTTVQHQQLPPRPKLVPTYPSADAPRKPSSAPRGTQDDNDLAYLPFALSGLDTHGEDEEWISIISAPAHAPLPSWLAVMQSLIRHPERNSSNILRADILADTRASPSNAATQGWVKQWTVRRALLPRRPNLDWRMEQDCSLFYRLRSSGEHGDGHDEMKEVEEAVVVYTPLIGDVTHAKMDVTEAGAMGQVPASEGWIPFYHPKVRALAFHYRPSLLPLCSNDSEPVFGELSISLIPFRAPLCSFPPSHRLSRVGLSLLTTLHMHTWGDLHSYQKRVHHDTIVPRTLYQDLYLALKAKYAAELIAGWREATDPAKHVFEEMGIAAYLIGLWTLSYAQRGHAWRRAVKFVDVGCGNGLLSYILAREGFSGIGLDMRARKSWALYAAHVTLREWTFNPSSLLTCSEPEWTDAWLLGNHADQLTPWLPLLAAHHRAAGFINLPCCYYALDGTRDFPLLLKAQSGAQVSRNEQYLAYVAQLHERFGWEVELDPLRIPSTKNWCFVGRRRVVVASKEEAEQKAETLKTRVDEAVHEALRGAWANAAST